MSESEKFNIRFPKPELIPMTADKLRYYRYKTSLLQREIAEYAGINESTYASYENGDRDYYPLDKLSKIAELLKVDVTLLLDDYNRFLFEGQGSQIRRLRKNLEMTQVEFGKRYSVHGGTVKKWESGKVRIYKDTWKKLFLYSK